MHLENAAEMITYTCIRCRWLKLSLYSNQRLSLGLKSVEGVTKQTKSDYAILQNHI